MPVALSRTATACALAPRPRGILPGLVSLATALATTAFLPPAARADILVATRPGLLCASPDALAALTLPDGSSRAASPAARPADAATRRQGGCIDLAPGMRVDRRTAHRNTSLVFFDANDGRGPQPFTAPNIDFAPAETSPNPATSSACIAYQAPVTLIGTITVGSAYGEDPRTGVVGTSHWQQLTLPRPICTLASADGSEQAEHGVRSMALNWLTPGKWPFAPGQHVTVTGTLAGRTRSTENTAVLFDATAVTPTH